MKVIFIVGATASGKSQYALKEAEKHIDNHREPKSCIINCDSIQVYQGLVIGSALPSKEEMRQVPHYLFSYIPKGQKITAGQYCRDFYNLMDQIGNKYKFVYVVGGTGFYFQAIEKGMYQEGAANLEIKAQLEEQIKTEEGTKKLYKEFKEKDPKAAEKISPNDRYRLIRAMELMRTHNKTLTEIQNEFVRQKKQFPWPLEKIGVQTSKEELLKRIQLRTKMMLENGLIDEVQTLIAEGYSSWQALQSVGYKETLEYLQKKTDEHGKLKISSLKNLEERIVLSTMQLAKKQKTWFQRDQEIHWI